MKTIHVHYHATINADIPVPVADVRCASMTDEQIADYAKRIAGQRVDNELFGVVQSSQYAPGSVYEESDATYEIEEED